eukprot:TRINITY_DN36049_c0_g1_i1.p1 TRINITY_DN36049_c0_g1~~TRINITY_DN36049_c0_g1_i1.p1  ORF type:complete len:344 (+),score=87.28 TRINITY_DN36049_c0_g1_i1:55-1032(+)
MAAYNLTECLYKANCSLPLVSLLAGVSDEKPGGSDERGAVLRGAVALSASAPSDALGSLRPGETGHVVAHASAAESSAYVRALAQVGRSICVRGPRGDVHWYSKLDLVPASKLDLVSASEHSQAQLRTPTPTGRPAYRPKAKSVASGTISRAIAEQQKEYVRGHGLHLMLGEAMDSCLRELPTDPFTHIAQTLLLIRARNQNSTLTDVTSPRVAVLEQEVAFLRQRLAQTRLERDLEKEASVLRQQASRMGASPVSDVESSGRSQPRRKLGRPMAATPEPPNSGARGGERSRGGMNVVQQPHPPQRPQSAAAAPRRAASLPATDY